MCFSGTRVGCPHRTSHDRRTRHWPLHAVACSQFGWDWKIEIVDETSGFAALVQTGDTVTAELAYIRDLGGFTGTYGQDVVGDAQARVTEGTFLISGTAVGFHSQQPDETATAAFTIKTDC